MKRRIFLQTAGATLPWMLHGTRLHAIGKSSLFEYVNEDSDKILVLLQCNGGYDGLNMLLPKEYYGQLQAVRSNILLPESSLFPLSDELGLHPKLSSIGQLFREGQIGFIQSVGYPNQNRSHFRSKDIWLSGSAADEYISTGWLGRYLDTEYPDFPGNYPNTDHTDPFAITMGSSISETCQGIASNFGMTINDPFNLTPLTISDGAEVPDNYYGRQLNFLRDVMVKSNEYAEVVKTAAVKGNNKVEYPNYGLAKHLRNISLLIAGGLRTKIYVVNLGGFDTHANQTEANDPTGGRHGRLLAEMSASLQSFQNDLMALGLDQRVLTLAYTEFGRRIRSNGSLGTDHGSAAPLILMGTCARGQILGENVRIDTEVGNKDGVPMQFDFRSVYGTILHDWFEVPENKIRELLYSDYQRLPILQDCRTTTDVQDFHTKPLALELYPNPVREKLNIRFTLPEAASLKIRVISAEGKLIQLMAHELFSEGTHHLNLDCLGISPGNYFIHVEGRYRYKAASFLVIR